MDFFYNILEFIKGSNGTWPQTIVVATILNFRFWVFLILIFLLDKILKNKSIIKFIILSLITIMSAMDVKQMVLRQKEEKIEYTTKFYDKNTENLVIVIQGANNPFNDCLDKNKTQVDIVNSRDNDGLGFIELKNNDTKTKVLTYVGSYSYNLTPQEVYTTIYYYKMMKPNGRVILIGHSLGGFNVTQVLDKLSKNNIEIELVVFLDIANKKNNSVNYFVKSNVNNVVNLTSDTWSDNFYFFTNSGGQVYHHKSNVTTKIINTHIKNTTHTTIDNKTHIMVYNLVKNTLNNHSPIDYVIKYKF
jgi:hypothetical protein